MAERLKAPLGYIDLRHAIASMWGRMYMSGVPQSVIEAAEARVAQASTTIQQIAEQVRTSSDPKPIALIIDALKSKDLKLFVYSGVSPVVVSVPPASVNAALERTGFLQLTAENAACRFMDFYPRRILDDVRMPGFNSFAFDRFAFCLKAKAFDAWLAGTARRLRWPLDVKRQPRSGRPTLVHLIRPILQDLIVSGRWKQSMPLKSLVVSIRHKINGPKIDRETVKRVMDDLYRETGNLEYRYVRRPRRASTKPRTRPD
jgi:hypothetical protein